MIGELLAADVEGIESVSAVGVVDKPVIHLAHMQDFLDHLAGITLAQLYIFGKEFGAADFYGVGI